MIANNKLGYSIIRTGTSQKNPRLNNTKTDVMKDYEGIHITG